MRQLLACLALAALTWGPTLAATSCLPDGNGVPKANRSFIRINGTATPLIFARDSWPMTIRIMAQVYAYILEEVYGIHTKLAVGAGVPGFYGMASCNCLFCNKPVCGNGLPTTHVVIGLSSSWVIMKQYVRKNHPERYPVYLGEVGFETQGIFLLRDATRRKALSSLEVTLDFYRSYNLSSDVSQFFSNISGVPYSRLMPCNRTTQTATAMCNIHARTDGKNDPEGVDIDAAGNCRARCHVDGFWWLAPACRQEPHRCVPVFTMFGGTAFLNALASATVYNIPWAIGIPATYKDYLTLPLDFNVLTFALTPESAFNTIKPVELRFPRFSEPVINGGGKRDSNLRQESFIYNGWAGAIEGVAGFQIREVLQRMQWSKEQAEQVSARFLEIYKAQGYPAKLGPAYKATACDYLKKNKAVWGKWLPLASECPLGQGMHAGASFVFSRDLADGCQWCSLGRFSLPRWDELGLTHVCLPCPAGQEQITSGQASCSACLPGRYKSREGPDLCEDCPPGNATELPGQQRCPACRPGRAAAEPAQLACQTCPKGTSAPEEGAVVCGFCARGSFADEGGCKPCTEALRGSTSERGAARAEECVCPAGYYKKGSCVPCMEGLECPGGNGEPHQAVGYWVDVDDGSDYTIYRCRNGLECPGGSLGDCATGREDAACNNCKDGYFPAEDGSCLPCGATSRLPLLACGLLVVLLLSAFVVRKKVDASRQHLNLIVAMTVAGQMLFTMQALSAMRQIRIPWPEELRSLLDFFSLFIFDLEVLGLPCLLSSDNPVGKFVSKFLAYPIFLLLLLALFLFSRIVGRPLEKVALINANGTFLLAVYISLTLAMALPFQCQGNPSGFLSMATQPGVRCFEDPTHISLSVLASLGILIYPVGIAAYVAHATMQCKSMAHTMAGVQVVRRFQFIFQRYRPECYHFGLVFLLRNCLVALVPVLFVGAPVLQINVIALVLLVGLVLQVRFQPWRAPTPNSTDTALGIVLVMFAALLDSTSQGVSVAMTAIVVLCFLGILLVLLLTLQRHFFPRKLYGIFLCHHKAAAGNLCRLLQLLLAEKTSRKVFVDSDHLEDLDQLFEIVRSSVENLVVVLSQKVLAHPWCAGEIVTAHRNGVNMLTLACEDVGALEVGQVEAAWSEHELSLLGRFGIQPEMVQPAFEALLQQRQLRLPRMLPLSGKQAAMEELVELCELQAASSSLAMLRTPSLMLKRNSQEVSEVKVLVTGFVNEPEALAACEIMQLELQRQLQVGVAVVRSPQQLLEEAEVLLVLWSRGVLADEGFAEVIMAANGRPLCAVTALADPAFQFPSGALLQALQRPGLAEAYERLLKLHHRPFDPRCSQAVVCEQVEELASRIKRLLGGQAWQARSSWGLRLQEEAQKTGKVLDCL